MSQLADIREERGQLAKRMTDMVEAAAKDNKREFTAEESETFEKLDAEQTKLRSLIDRLEKTDSINDELSKVRNVGAGREDRVITKLVKPEDEQLAAWRSFLVNGVNNMPQSEINVLRALSVGTASAGGYSAPAQPTSEFVKKLRDLTSVRQAPVKVITTNYGNDIPFPTFDDTSNTAETNAEGTAAHDDVDPTFGQITLKSYAFDSNVVRINKRLLQDSVIPVESLINDALAERLAVKLNPAYTTGNGTTAPQGIVTGAGNSGVSLPAGTLGANGGTIYQNMQAIIHSIAPQYRNANKSGNAVGSFGVMFNDQTLLKLKQTVDAQNRPLWNASFTAGQPDLICGVPYYINPDMADIGASAKSIVVGDFSKFYVRDVAQVEFIRLEELYAAYLEVGFLAWFRTDSKVMNSSAIKYVAHASS